MRKNLTISVLYTIVTAIILGIAYPLVITALSQALFHSKANGQLLTQDGQVIGSRIIGQPFTGPGYFHSRPSAAGTGYDASSSSGSNLGPTSKKYIDRVEADVATDQAIQPGPVPVDLVTTSASGLDPDITPAAAYYQIPRIAQERKIPENTLKTLVEQHIEPRQFGLLGEPRVNVLLLNLDLDQKHY